MPNQRRFIEIDGLRGLMLILMTVTHLPTMFSGPLGQPLGFVSAAEGFVFLSAFLVGTVYSKIAARQGLDRMRDALLSRSAKVYAVHLAILVGVLVLVVRHGHAAGNTEITNWFSFYASQPRLATASALVLVYNPPLFDILPMYVVFLALTPMVLRHALSHGWTGCFVASAAGWVGAQAGVGNLLYDAFAAWTNFPVPHGATGAFSWLAWQFLWVVGLCVGCHMVGRTEPIAIPRTLVWLAAVVAICGFVWRHAVGQAPFGGDQALNAWFDKWDLGPARLVNFVALAIVGVHLRARISPVINHPLFATLGNVALPVFCTHLVLCAVAIALWKPAAPHAWWEDAGLLLGSLGVMYLVAAITTRLLAQPMALPAGGRPAISGRTTR